MSATIIPFPVERTKRAQQSMSPVQQIVARTRRKLSNLTRNTDPAQFKQHQDEMRELWRDE